MTNIQSQIAAGQRALTGAQKKKVEKKKNAIVDLMKAQEHGMITDIRIENRVVKQ